ncbi:MAG TPA: tripartite tricarboxylate transporter substrate binding protein [Advenella kashmirensis]|uniref:Tripartite tricarboxylate transporter substrate binding protein n=1 Tax=Advenella kashmirensis TaxID=310575 RepID=A0A356LG18_9BURK|nr:tripartite tricarboxylate transporter substrate binding protein [Advenella kashmirensis]
MFRIIPQVLALLMLSASSCLMAFAHAETGQWPQKPVSFVLPSAAGGSPDVLSRLVMNQVSQQMNATFVVENRPGAAGSIGMVQLKRAAADGYTIGYGNINTLAVNRSLFNTLNYDVQADFAPVIHLFNLYNVLIVPADSSVKSVTDLIEKARKAPNKLSYGASGVGTTGHMGGELFKSLAKIEVQFIPYTGGPAALQDLVGGRLDFMFTNSSEAMPMIKSGKVRALGVSSLKRLELLPEVPTLDEAGVKGYETVAWGGVVAPNGTPGEIIQTLNKALGNALRAPEVLKGLALLGAEPVGGSPEQFTRLIDLETRKWRQIIETAGIEKLN